MTQSVTINDELFKKLPSAQFGGVFRPPEARAFHQITGGVKALFGYTSDELRADPRKFWDQIPPEDRVKLEDAIGEAETHRSTCEHVIRFRQPDDSIKWISLLLSPWQTPSSKPQRWKGYAHDVSTLMERELTLLSERDELLSANHNLRRSLSNAENRFQLAQRRADAKGQFLAMMSHEIRTPLNSIVGFADLLMEQRTDEEQRDFSQRINESAEMLLSLINDILDYTRLDARTLELDREPMSIQDDINQVIGMLEVRAQAKSIQLQTRIEGRLPEEALGDSVRFRQILINLIANAINFTDEGEVVCTFISGYSTTERLWHLQCSVRDTGVGIEEEKIPFIFDPFVQVTQIGQSERRGSGLGLAICRLLVEYMGGSLSCLSEPGKGSTFEFAIPFGKHERKAPIASLKKSFTRDPFLSRPLKILCAEDNPSNQAVIKAMLKSLGQKATVVSDGTELLSQLKTVHPDVVLMDVQMPHVDGLEATRQIRQGACGKELQQIYIIGVTAFALAGDRERSIAVGMNDFIPKPIKRGDLQRSLELAMTHLEALQTPDHLHDPSLG